MRQLLVLGLVALLSAPAAGQGMQSESGFQASVIFYAGAPGAGGGVVAAGSLEMAGTAETERATHANLRVRTASFVFVVARTAARGRPVGETDVRLNGTTRTLASIAADLQAGFTGRAAILVFIRASGGAQHAESVAVINTSRTTAGARIDVSGATHVMLVAHGQVQTFTIVRSGTSLSSIQIRASGDGETSLGAAAGDGVATIVDILGKIGIKIGN